MMALLGLDLRLLGPVGAFRTHGVRSIGLIFAAWGWLVHNADATRSSQPSGRGPSLRQHRVFPFNTRTEHSRHFNDAALGIL